MTTMIERVQSAIVNAALREGDRIDPNVAEECARAAITAMRDLDAGWPEILRVGKSALYSCSSDPEIEDARLVWHAMIDAALTEPPDS